MLNYVINIIKNNIINRRKTLKIYISEHNTYVIMLKKIFEIQKKLFQ